MVVGLVSCLLLWDKIRLGEAHPEEITEVFFFFSVFSCTKNLVADNYFSLFLNFEEILFFTGATYLEAESLQGEWELRSEKPDDCDLLQV